MSISKLRVHMRAYACLFPDQWAIIMVYSGYTSIDSLFNWFLFFFHHSRYYECDEDVQSDYELQNFMNEVSADGVGIDGGNGNVRKAKFLPFEAFYKIGWPMTFLAQEITCTTRIKDPIVMRKGLISDVFLANTNSPRWGNILRMNQTNVLLF